MSLPERLFRFFPPVAKNFLRDEKLWFSTIRDFNDVFEVRPQFGESIQRQASEVQRRLFAFTPPHVDWHVFKENVKLTPEQVEEENEKFANFVVDHFDLTFGVVCFCAEHGSPAVWGHYTRSSTGFGIEFDVNHDFFRQQCNDVIMQVTYSENRPQYSTEDRVKIMAWKSEEWRYESEYRLILPKDHLHRALRSPGDKIERFYLPLPRGAVRAVYLGLHIDPEVEEILVQDANKLGVPLFWMKPHLTQFKLMPFPYMLKSK